MWASFEVVASEAIGTTLATEIGELATEHTETDREGVMADEIQVEQLASSEEVDGGKVKLGSMDFGLADTTEDTKGGP